MVDCQMDILSCDLPERYGRSIIFDVKTPWFHEHRIWIKKKPPHNVPLWPTPEFCDYLSSKRPEVPCFIEMRYTDAPLDNLKHKGNKEELVGIAKIDLINLILCLEASPLMKHLDLVDVLDPGTKLVGKIYVRVHCALWRDLQDILWNKTRANFSPCSSILVGTRNTETADRGTFNRPLGSPIKKYFGESPDSPLHFGNSKAERNNLPQTSPKGQNWKTERLHKEGSLPVFGNTPDVVRIRNILRTYSDSDYGPFSPNHEANSTKSSVKLLEKVTQKRSMTETVVSPKRIFVTFNPTTSNGGSGTKSVSEASTESGLSNASGSQKIEEAPHVREYSNEAFASRPVRSHRIAANIFGGMKK